MSNFEEYRVCFATLAALIDHAQELQDIGDRIVLFPESLDSTRLYEAQALDNIVGEMRLLINEIHKRSAYLKNVTAEDI